MASVDLLVGGGLTTAAAFVYAYLAWRCWRRPVDPEARSANRGFAVWWAALGGAFLILGVSPLLFYAGITSLTPHVVLLYARPLFAGLAGWGLAHYVAYLYTGREGWRTPLAVLYGAFAVGLVAFYASASPAALVERGGEVHFQWANDPVRPLAVALLASALLPLMVAVAAYARTFLTVHDPAKRFRVLMVTAGIVVWGAGFVVARVSVDLWLASDLLRLAAPFVVLVGFGRADAPRPSHAPRGDVAGAEGFEARLQELL